METNERLEIEDEDKRQRRIESLLERTNNSPASKDVFTSRSSFVLPITTGVGSSSAPSELLLDRVRDFLPQIAASNAALSDQTSDAIDIENVAEDEDHYIEMNLGLGVFEYRRLEQHSSSSSESDSDTESSTSSDGSSAVGSSEEDAYAEDTFGKKTSSIKDRPIKPFPKRARPEIIVMGGESSTAEPARSPTST